MVMQVAQGTGTGQPPVSHELGTSDNYLLADLEGEIEVRIGRYGSAKPCTVRLSAPSL